MPMSSATRTKRSSSLGGVCERGCDSDRASARSSMRVVTDVATLARYRLLVRGHGLIGEGSPTEPTGLNAAGGAQFALQLGVFEHSLHLLRDAIRVRGWDQDRGFSADLRKRG